MRFLLAQNGTASLWLTGLFCLTGIGACIMALREKKYVYLGVAAGTVIAMVYVFVVLLLDRFAIEAPRESPSFAANTVAAVFLALAALGAFVWLAIGKRPLRWLEAIGALLGLPFFGFMAATMWLYADWRQTHPSLDYLARFAATASIVLGFLVAIAFSVVAYTSAYESRRRRGSG